MKIILLITILLFTPFAFCETSETVKFSEPIINALDYDGNSNIEKNCSLSREDDAVHDNIEQVEEDIEDPKKSEGDGRNEEKSYKPQPLRDHINYRYIILSSLLIGGHNTFGLYSLERAVSATIAISKVSFDKKLTWKQKKSGIGYYSRQYGYLVAYLIINKYKLLHSNHPTGNSQHSYSYSHEGASQGSDRSFFAPRVGPNRSELFSQMQQYVPNIQVPQNESGFKKMYRRAALIHHPDKGGDPEVFKIINSLNQQYFNL